MNDCRPIFLISQPRSGSTLLQRIISRHQAVLVPAEPHLLLVPFMGLKPEIAEEGLGKPYPGALPKVVAKAVREFAGNYCGDREVIREAVRAYADVMYGAARATGGERYLLDKTPRYYRIVDEIRWLYPESKIVILRRNPLSVMNSILSTWLANRYSRLVNFRRDLLDAPAQLDDFVRRDPGCHLLRYEALVTEPDATLQTLFDYLELDYSPEFKSYQLGEKPKGSFGDPVGVHRHQEPVTDSVTAWVTALEERKRAVLFRGYLEWLGEPLVTRLGYDYRDMAGRLDGARPRLHDLRFGECMGMEKGPLTSLKKRLEKRAYQRILRTADRN